MAGEEAAEPTRRAAVAPTPSTVSVSLQLTPDTLKLIDDLSAKLDTDPADVLGEALTFFSAVKEAHDAGGLVVVPSGVVRSKFQQKISLE